MSSSDQDGEFTNFRALNDVINRIKATRKHNTFRMRRADLKRFGEWCLEEGVDPVEASWRDLDRFLLKEEGVGYKQGTMKARFYSLQVCYEAFSGVFGLREENPVEHLHEEDYLSVEEGGSGEVYVYVDAQEVDVLANHVGPPAVRNELLIRLTFQTSCRPSTLVRIGIENIDRDKRTIRVFSPKLNSAQRDVDPWRTVVYQESLDHLIRIYLEGGERDRYTAAKSSDGLFLGPKGPLGEAVPNRVVKDAAERAGIQEVLWRDAAGNDRRRITAKALRHGHAVNALKSGVDPRSVQKQMGHEDLETTVDYLRFLKSDLIDAYGNWS